MSQPWSAGDYPYISHWIDANAEAIAVLEEASEKPRFWHPLLLEERTDTLISAQLPFRFEVREASKALAARVTLNASIGEFDEAIADILTLHRLGRLLGLENTLLDQLFSHSIVINATEQAAGMLNADGLSVSDVESLRRQLEQRQPIDSIQRTILFDRCAIVGAAEQLVQGTASDQKENWFMLRLVNSLTDWDEILTRVTELLDEIDDALLLSRPYDQLQAMAAWNERFHAQFKPGSRQAVILNIFPAVGPIHVSEVRTRAQIELVRIATYCRQFQIERGRFPNTLEELATHYQIPLGTDLFTDDKPFRYRVVQGHAILWSTGPSFFEAVTPEPGEANDPNQIGRHIPFDIRVQLRPLTVSAQ